MNKTAIYIDYTTNEIVVINSRGEEIYRHEQNDDSWVFAYFKYCREKYHNAQ